MTSVSAISSISTITSISSNKTQTKTWQKAALLLIGSLLVTPAFAADSGQHLSKAGKHSALAVSAGIATTVKVASAVVAVPLIATGSVMVVAGTMSTEAGASVMDKIDHHDEIIISDITVTADPSPREAMKHNRMATKEVQTSKVQTSRTVITTKTTVKAQEQK
jgi:hypothetical protein